MSEAGCASLCLLLNNLCYLRLCLCSGTLHLEFFTVHFECSCFFHLRISALDAALRVLQKANQSVKAHVLVEGDIDAAQPASISLVTALLHSCSSFPALSCGNGEAAAGARRKNTQRMCAILGLLFSCSQCSVLAQLSAMCCPRPLRYR